MSELWTLPGYDVEALIGFGATGEVWRAREQETGETVALKRLRDVADPTALAALRREATLLATLDTPYVVRLRAVVDDVLVLDHAPGGSLATVLARRRALDPGEVITVAAPLAAGLAAAHAAGLVHGDVSPANVLFTADGMPMLSDLGVARLAGQQLASVDGTAEYVDPAVARGGEPDAAADVWSLAAVCHHLLAGTPPHDGVSAAAVLGAAVAGERAPLGLLAPHAPRPLVAAIEAALQADPRARPDAAGFASLLRRAHAASPVRFALEPSTAPVVEERPTHVVRVTAPGTAMPGRHRRRRPPRSTLPVAGLVLLVVLAAVVGWISGRADPPRPAAAASPLAVRPATDVPEQDWRAVLEGLDAARADAFSSGAVDGLTAVWGPGSAALRVDTASLTRLGDRGEHATGLRHRIESVEVVDVAAEAHRARLRVVDVLAAHEVRAATGDVVQRVPARPEVAWHVELVRTPEGWRLSSVTPASSPD